MGTMVTSSYVKMPRVALASVRGDARSCLGLAGVCRRRAGALDTNLGDASILRNWRCSGNAKKCKMQQNSGNPIKIRTFHPMPSIHPIHPVPQNLPKPVKMPLTPQHFTKCIKSNELLGLRPVSPPGRTYNSPTEPRSPRIQASHTGLGWRGAKMQ